jgi:hypothetical protein
VASGQAKLDELAGIDFLDDDAYRQWTKKVIELQKALVLQIEAGRQMLRPLLEATPTAEGWRSNSLVGSKKAARTVFNKLGRASKSITFAAGQTAAAYRSFERDYFGEMAGQQVAAPGMRINGRQNGSGPGGPSARQQTAAFWAPVGPNQQHPAA